MGSKDKVTGKKAVHTVGAWVNENQLVLGQIKVFDKSNEITVIPELLELLDVSECTVTIDAMGTQKKIAQKIIEGKADYILGLKGNQGTLYEDVKTFVDDQLDSKITDRSYQFKKTTDADHGRIENRKFHLFNDLSCLDQSNDWKGLNSIGVVESSIEIKGEIHGERRYYITSLESLLKDFQKTLEGTGV